MLFISPAFYGIQLSLSFFFLFCFFWTSLSTNSVLTIMLHKNTHVQKYLQDIKMQYLCRELVHFQLSHHAVLLIHLCVSAVFEQHQAGKHWRTHIYTASHTPCISIRYVCWNWTLSKAAAKSIVVPLKSTPVSLVLTASMTKQGCRVEHFIPFVQIKFWC